MKDRHTSEYLKEEVIKIIEIYKCSLDQVFCCTIDNGANMVKCVKLLETKQESDINKTVGNDIRDEGNLNNIEKSLETILRCVRCASHTLQVRKIYILNKLILVKF